MEFLMTWSFWENSSEKHVTAKNEASGEFQNSCIRSMFQIWNKFFQISKLHLNFLGLSSAGFSIILGSDQTSSLVIYIQQHGAI